MDISIPSHIKIYLSTNTFKIIQLATQNNVKFNKCRNLRKITLQRAHWKAVNIIAKQELAK